MCEYGFSSGNEFFPILEKTSEQGGRPVTDYNISVDMAKQICMIQRSEKGRQYREYFLALEKAWNTPAPYGRSDDQQPERPMSVPWWSGAGTAEGDRGASA